MVPLSLRSRIFKSQIANCKSQIMPTASKDIVVSNKLGLHARPAMQFVDQANQFKSDIRVHKFGDEPGEADGKSVMEMIILAATEGTKMRIDANGDDAHDAVAKLAELFETKFGEED
jgi:phosphocarrier protein